MPKVSVIIPIYGVEPYIERCVRSLMEQTLDDIEYIFVNDCTPDRSIEILNDVIKDYPDRVSHVSIINMEQNSGQAAVRRKGIELATGEYIIHCDSDDYVDKDMYRLMYDKAIEGCYDIVVCDFNENVGEYSSAKNGLTTEDADLAADILMAKSWGTLWNKLVKNRIVNLPNIKAPVSNLAEDLVLSVQYCLSAHSIGYVHSPLYNYCRRSDSTLGGRSTEQIVKKFKAFKSNFDITISAIEDAGKREIYGKEIMHECLHIKNQLLPVLKQNNDYLSLWKETYCDINCKVIPSSVFTIREKLNYIITFLGLYPRYNKFAGK